MKSGKILVLILCFILVFGLTFIVAEKADKGAKGLKNESNKSIDRDQNRTHDRDQNRTNRSEEKVRRENHGACVSVQAKIKNSCYKEKKEGFKTCEKQRREQFKEERGKNSTEAINKSQLKNQTKERKIACRETFKTGLDQCKATFNASRQSCEFWKCASNQTFGNGTCISL